MRGRGYPSARSSRRPDPMCNGAPPAPSEDFRREVDRYYSTHTPEGPMDPQPRTTSSKKTENGLSNGEKASDLLQSSGRRKSSSRRSAFDYYEAEEEEEESAMFLQEKARHQPRLHLNRDLRIYQITQVTSPTQFYMVEVSPQRGVLNQYRRLPGWWVETQAFYNLCDKDHSLHFKSVPRVGRLYVLYCSYLMSWERVRVLTVNEAREQCRVFFIDAGVFADHAWSDLREAPSSLKKPRALALVGQLQHVYPAVLMDGKIFNSNLVEPEERPSKMWSNAAVEFMKIRGEGKFFYGVNIQETQVAVTFTGELHEVIPQNIKFGMVFVELSLRSGKTLNAELCLTGNAICTGMGASAACLFSNAPHFAKLFYFQKRTAGPAGYIFGKKMNDKDERDFKILAEIAKTMKGKSFMYDHVIENPQDFDTWRVYGNPNEELERVVNRIPEVIRQNVNLCDITVINSPACFYVLPQERIPALKEISKFIASKTKKPIDQANASDWPTPINPRHIHVGRPIVLKQQFFGNDYFGNKFAWYRAVVKQIYTNRQRARVVLIDIGLEVRVHVVDVYEMPLPLQIIPALCFRAHLNITNWGPVGKSFWPNDAIQTFRSYQPSWYNGAPAYYVWESFPKNRVRLDLFNQNLTCSTDGSYTWVAAPYDPDDMTIRCSVRSKLLSPREINDIRLAEKALVEEARLKQEKLRQERAAEARRMAAQYIRLAPGVQMETAEHEPPVINYWELRSEPCITQALIEDLFLPLPHTAEEIAKRKYLRRRDVHRNKAIAQRERHEKEVLSRSRKYERGDLKLTPEEAASLNMEVYELGFQLTPDSSPSSSAGEEDEDDMSVEEIKQRHADKIKELEKIRDRLKQLCAVERQLTNKELNGNGEQVEDAQQHQPSLIAGYQHPNYLPFQRMEDQTFELLCGPLFTSIGVNFEFEINLGKRPSEFLLLSPLSILRNAGHVERIVMGEEFGAITEQEMQMKIRILPEKFNLFKRTEDYDYE